MNYMQDVGEQVFIVTERLNFTTPNPAIRDSCDIWWSAVKIERDTRYYGTY